MARGDGKRTCETYLSKLQNIIVQITNFSDLYMYRCICINCKFYRFVHVQMYLAWHEDGQRTCKMYLSKLQNALVSIAKCICTNYKCICINYKFYRFVRCTDVFSVARGWAAHLAGQTHPADPGSPG